MNFKVIKQNSYLFTENYNFTFIDKFIIRLIFFLHFSLQKLFKTFFNMFNDT